jgi:hypothetical protein
MRRHDEMRQFRLRNNLAGDRFVFPDDYCRTKVT